MLIEYQIKFEKDGLTITQHIEPNSIPVAHNLTKMPVTGLPASLGEVKSLAPRNPLYAVGAPSEKPGGSGDPVGPVSGSTPIFILGPFIFGGSVPTEVTKSVEPPPQDTTLKAKSQVAGE